MPTFRYVAFGADGREQAGAIQAEDRVSALSQVESMGLAPTKLEAEAAAATPRATLDPAKIRLGPQRTLAGMRQLASLLAAGVPMARALKILRRETNHPPTQALWREIHDRVSDGDELATAMRGAPFTFTPVQVAMVRAGETGGFLDVVLKQIAEFMTRERELRSRVTAAMVYPTVLAVVATCVVIFLLAWFIPKFSTIFAEFGQSLPLLTQMIQAISLVLINHGPIALLIGAGVGFACARALRSPAGRRWRDRQIPRVPGVGPVVLRFALVRFSRMLGSLITAGVPLVSALRVAREAVGNQMLADALERSIHDVQHGASLAASFAQCPQLFTPSVVEMVAVAEESGRLGEELIRMAGEFEDDLDRQLRTLVALAEPAMLFIMAAVVGTIVIGMLLPVFDLWDAVQ